VRRVRNALPAALALLQLLAGSAHAAPADLAAALPAAAALPPLVGRGGIEHHTAETLWERIDGEAELYRSYGFAASAHARYEDPAEPDRRVELSVFAFADALGAFGLFAAFRPPECTVLPLGNGACVGGEQGFFWHGDLFVLADAAGPAAARRDDLHRALTAAAALLGPPPPRPEPLRAFSRLVDTRTIRYQPQHLLGRAALPPGLEGTAGGTPVFLSTGADAGQGAAALAAYARVLAGEVRVERNGFTVLSGRDPALGPVTIVGGRHGISGARSAPDSPGVQRLLESLVAHGGDPALEGAW
jgi:hypothetical protein